MATTAERVLQQEAPPATGRPTHASALIYRWGAIAAVLAAVLTALAVTLFAVRPPPAYDEGARVWFEHINDNALLGWMSLDLPFLVITILMIPVMVALVAALHRVRPAHVAVASAFYLVAIATYFGTNTSAELIALSSRYAEATSEVQRVTLLGAGEALLSAFNGTAFHVNYILAQTAGIILGFVMLRSSHFSPTIAYLMIGGNAFGFLLYLPEFGVTLSAPSGVILWFWMISVSRGLMRLSTKQQAPGVMK